MTNVIEGGFGQGKHPEAKRLEDLIAAEEAEGYQLDEVGFILGFTSGDQSVYTSKLSMDTLCLAVQQINMEIQERLNKGEQ